MLTTQARRSLLSNVQSSRKFATISSIKAREIIDSRGNPTVEADV
jgi:hypothetical protein